MSISLRLDSVNGSDADIELTEDPFTVLNDSAPASDSESQLESDSSFIDIDDLDDEIEDEEIDTTEVDEHQVNQELEYVSSHTIRVMTL